MDTVWWLLGVVVLLATLADVFLTALNYDEAGFLAGPFSRGLWRVLRSVTHRLPRDRRPVVLRQVTGVQVIGVVLLWIVGTITGYGLIYYGLMTPTSFTPAAPRELDLFDAMYFSAAQLSTVGGSDLTAATDLLRFLSIAETLTGVVLVSMILTFLLGVYDVIGSLNTLCTRFVSAERGAGSPVATLRPYLRPGGEGADGHLDAISDAFADYTSGVRLHHAAYFFQSGRDRFALPYALRMIGGTLGALRWGLPTGHPASTSPTLPALTFQYLEFGEYLQATVRWSDEPEPPEPVDRDTFERIVRGGARVEQRDPWVARFTQLELQLADVIGSDPLADLDDAHRRYTQWLPFAYRAEVVTTSVGRDLDYQPVIVTDVPVSLLHGDRVAVRNVESYLTDPVPPRHDRGRLRGRLSSRLSLLDPGGARLRTAVRGLVSAVVAALTALLVARGLGEQDQVRPVIFAGFVAMLASGAVAGRGAARRLRAAVSVLAVVLVVVVLAAASSGSHLWTGAAAVLVAVVAAWASRFGPRYAGLGTVGFMAFYYALLMRLEASDVLLYAAGAVLGVGWPLLLGGALMPERPVRVLRAALDSYRREMVATLEVLEDGAAWGRWDRVLAHRLNLAQRRLRRGSEFLAGRLSTGAEAADLDERRARTLRLHIFSANLAEEYLVAAVRSLPAAGVSLELRGRLAGRLELLRAHVTQAVLAGADGPPSDDWRREKTPVTWPREARAVHRAVDELAHALDSLRHAEQGATDRDLETDDALDARQPAPAPPRRALAPATRRAVQAGLAVAAGLLVGDALSSSHQYWAMLAAYQVLGASDAETFVKGGQRVAGTVAGTLVGFGVAIATGGDHVALVVMVAIGIFGSLFYRGVSTAVQVFFTMVIFSTVYETLGRLTPGTVELRIVETAVGSAIALVVAAVVLPTRTRVLVDRDLARLVRDLQLVLDGVFARLERSDGTASVAALNSHLLVIDDQVRRIGVTADPLLRSGGVLDAGGVQQRLTAVQLVAYDVRYLVHALEQAHAVDADLSARDWAALRTTTADNMAALLAILEHRAVPAVHEDLGSAQDVDPHAPGAEHERAVLRRVDRVNRTVVLLISDLAPDAVEPVADPAPVAG
ncbi:FUSC family protein [Cellulomonas xiejunii]|uniref:FUSC family protein n=1 Tax=Cellulomonas xiejunii TaxID=2968083 RepID=A0ABY5KVL4_9CELL|nr:FUSC family protein [Cellulomonas xiejunii]MCC2322999.1 FUSC family protein [Cellulomonas xiejunii]UUI73496.1 FUSC family protein [Cellulomonas xiejunii]